MQPSTSVQSVSPRRTPRQGQQEAVNLSEQSDHLAVQLPTGYGKTFLAALIFAFKYARGLVDYLLYIVPTSAQLAQFEQDGSSDLADAGIGEALSITNIGYSSAITLNRFKSGACKVFACTVQALATERNGGSTHVWETVTSLLKRGKWMVVVDEYHHYGVDAQWGRKVASLPCAFRLLMSATPYRPKDDAAFGKPDYSIPYRSAVGEGAIKRLQCHSYVYQIDAIRADGEVIPYTTDQLVDEVGSSSPDAIDKFMIERQMRWSPKYVSPLVDVPIGRMIARRIQTGLPLQTLIGAMSCLHAQLVCEQVSSMFPELRVDWVGTGEHGRTDEDNKKVLKAFCPPKNDRGERDPLDVRLDVLVHVGMAGEGLDSVFVTEVVHLNPANINNQNNQENGRAARILPLVDRDQQYATINVDSTSPYAKFQGDKIMDVMDNVDAISAGEEGGIDIPDDDGDKPTIDLPEDPPIRIMNMECIRIDEGDLDRTRRAATEYARRSGVTLRDMLDPQKPEHEQIRELYLALRRSEAERFNATAVLQQWRNLVQQAVNVCVNKAVRMMVKAGQRHERSLVGDIKKRIQSRKKAALGPIDEAEVVDLKRHYQWCRNLEQQIVTAGLPEWLR